MFCYVDIISFAEQ